MSEAFLWGLVAGSSLVIGGIVALRIRIGSGVLGLVMAFGAGVLISAVAYELVQEAFHVGAGSGGVALGLVAGAAAFYCGDLLIDRLGGQGRKSSGGEQASGSPLAIVLGIVLDGVPEAMAQPARGRRSERCCDRRRLLSNLPEAMAATTGLAAVRWSRARILGLWTAVMLVTAVASLLGYALLDGASVRTLSFVLAFAGGAILTMLADTMMPEAFEHGGRAVGLATTLGFGLAFALTTLE